MSDEQPLVADDEPAIIPPDAEEQRPVLPKGTYTGTLTRYAQKVISWTNDKGPGSVRFDDISVSVVHPDLGIQFAGSSPFDKRFNTSFEAKSASSARRFRQQLGIEGWTNAQLAEWVKTGPEVVIDVENTQRPDKDNINPETGKPFRIVEATISDIHLKPEEA